MSSARIGKETDQTGYDFHSGCLRNQSMYVKEQMGHSSTDITVDVYGHLVPGGNREAVDKLDDGSEIPDQFGVETKWKHFEEKQASGRESRVASY